jgi:endonuclease/exonuclease/phosphatase family metal-dependent hydrolase
MGDFNDLPGSVVHQILTQPHTGLRDSWQILGRDEDDQSMTHHDFHGSPNKGRLDWILVSPHFRVKDAGIVRDRQNDRFPSDHFPYWVDLDWA